MSNGCQVVTICICRLNCWTSPASALASNCKYAQRDVHLVRHADAGRLNHPRVGPVKLGRPLAFLSHGKLASEGYTEETAPVFLRFSRFLLLQISQMALSDSSRQSLIPSFLYSSSSSKTLSLSHLLQSNHADPSLSPLPSVSPSVMSKRNNFVIPAPGEPGKIEMYSPAFYAACTAGGILSCGLTHMAVTPLDLVKCNMQVSFL